MALSGNTLGTAIKDAIGLLTDEQKANLETVWQTIGGVIVDHITANAVVSTTVTAEYLNPADVTGAGSGGVT